MGSWQPFRRIHKAAAGLLCAVAVLTLLFSNHTSAKQQHGATTSEEKLDDTVAYGRVLSFQSVNFDQKYMSEINDEVVLTQPDAQRTPLSAKLAATFRAVQEASSATSEPGEQRLAVLESCAHPGRFVVAVWDNAKRTYTLSMQPRPAQHSKRAKFRFALAGATTMRWTDGARGLVELYGRHQFGQLKLHRWEGSELFRADSSWRAVDGLSACTDSARRLAAEVRSDA